MKRILLSVAGGFLCLFAAAQGNGIAEIARQNGVGRLIKVSDRADRVKPDAAMNSIIVRDENGVRWRPGKKPVGISPQADESTIASDPTLQPESQAVETQAATVGVNINGLGYTSVNPPDPSLAAGPNHVIQMINGGSGAYFRIINKSGATLISQTYLDNLTGLGGLGDPVVLYDHLADRFVMTEFANDAETGSEGLIMAVSQTADPTGSWFVYYFSTGTSFPDYPKFSVWTDGYYATSNDFSPSYSGSTIYAFDRAKMLTGQALTTYQSVKFSTTSYSKYFAMCPVLLQGSTNPPAGTGGLIAYMFDDSWTSSTGDRDSIGIIEFDVNWTAPSASVITNISSLGTTAFKSSICTATRGQCIPMPGTTSKLEALHQRVMNQPIYRNFNGTGGIVFSFTVDIGSSVAGIRWYELRKAGAGNWGIHQESTYGPADGVYRWMPSMSYDGNGNIGLIYNVSNGSSVNPGVRYTGRLATDPLNTMTEAEGVIVNGTSRNGSTRYGDYNHLTADPAGTLWMTAQWNASTTWSTRIASITLSGAAPVCNAPSGTGETNITETSATVSWGAVSGANNYTVEYKAASSSTWLSAGNPTGTSQNITGLTAATVYDWRVRTNCASSSSAFVADQFTTAAPVVCNAPTGLNETGITENSASLNWTAAGSAVNYTVEYKAASSGTWLSAGTPAGTSQNLGGLSAGTTYDWRVRTNCASSSSAFVADQFTTASAATCDAPTGLASSGITPATANLSWSAVSGAVNYTVEYKENASATWLNATTTSATSYTLGGLNAATAYDWRVRTNCATLSSGYSQGSFTTAPEVTCTDAYEPNNTSGNAAGIAVNSTINALICDVADVDWYSFANNKQNKTVTVTLNIPAGVVYNMRLYRPNGNLAGTTSGTASTKTLSFSGNPTGTYRVEVFSSSGSSATSAYSLTTSMSSGNGPNGKDPDIASASKIAVSVTDNLLVAYPNPARGMLNLSFTVERSGKADVKLVDMQGKVVSSVALGVSRGRVNTSLNVSRLHSGLYMVQVTDGVRTLNVKVSIVQ